MKEKSSKKPKTAKFRYNRSQKISSMVLLLALVNVGCSVSSQKPKSPNELEQKKSYYLGDILQGDRVYLTLDKFFPSNNPSDASKTFFSIINNDYVLTPISSPEVPEEPLKLPIATGVHNEYSDLLSAPNSTLFLIQKGKTNIKKEYFPTIQFYKFNNKTEELLPTGKLINRKGLSGQLYHRNSPVIVTTGESQTDPEICSLMAVQSKSVALKLLTDFSCQQNHAHERDSLHLKYSDFYRVTSAQAASPAQNLVFYFKRIHPVKQKNKKKGLMDDADKPSDAEELLPNTRVYFVSDGAENVDMVDLNSTVAETGKNLLFGENQIFSINRLRIFYLKDINRSKLLVSFVSSKEPPQTGPSGSTSGQNQQKWAFVYICDFGYYSAKPRIESCQELTFAPPDPAATSLFNPDELKNLTFLDFDLTTKTVQKDKNTIKSIEYDLHLLAINDKPNDSSNSTYHEFSFKEVIQGSLEAPERPETALTSSITPAVNTNTQYYLPSLTGDSFLDIPNGVIFAHKYADEHKAVIGTETKEVFFYQTLVKFQRFNLLNFESVVNTKIKNFTTTLAYNTVEDGKLEQNPTPVYKFYGLDINDQVITDLSQKSTQIGLQVDTDSFSEGQNENLSYLISKYTLPDLESPQISNISFKMDTIADQAAIKLKNGVLKVTRPLNNLKSIPLDDMLFEGTVPDQAMSLKPQEDPQRTLNLLNFGAHEVYGKIPIFVNNELWGVEFDAQVVMLGNWVVNFERNDPKNSTVFVLKCLEIPSFSGPFQLDCKNQSKAEVPGELDLEDVHWFGNYMVLKTSKIVVSGSGNQQTNSSVDSVYSVYLPTGETTQYTFDDTKYGEIRNLTVLEVSGDLMIGVLFQAREKPPASNQSSSGSKSAYDPAGNALKVFRTRISKLPQIFEIEKISQKLAGIKCPIDHSIKNDLKTGFTVTLLSKCTNENLASIHIISQSGAQLASSEIPNTITDFNATATTGLCNINNSITILAEKKLFVVKMTPETSKIDRIIELHKHPGFSRIFDTTNLIKCLPYGRIALGSHIQHNSVGTQGNVHIFDGGDFPDNRYNPYRRYERFLTFYAYRGRLSSTTRIDSKTGKDGLNLKLDELDKPDLMFNDQINKTSKVYDLSMASGNISVTLQTKTDNNVTEGFRYGLNLGGWGGSNKYGLDQGSFVSLDGKVDFGDNSSIFGFEVLNDYNNSFEVFNRFDANQFVGGLAQNATKIRSLGNMTFYLTFDSKSQKTGLSYTTEVDKKALGIDLQLGDATECSDFWISEISAKSKILVSMLCKNLTKQFIYLGGIDGTAMKLSNKNLIDVKNEYLTNIQHVVLGSDFNAFFMIRESKPYKRVYVSKVEGFDQGTNLVVNEVDIELTQSK